ncbi:hypothetical protein AKJ16_DCAP18942 [Drosera capensis]
MSYFNCVFFTIIFLCFVLSVGNSSRGHRESLPIVCNREKSLYILPTLES